MSNPATILASPVDTAEQFEQIKAELTAHGEGDSVATAKHLATVRCATFNGVKKGSEVLPKLQAKFPDISFEFDGEVHAMA